MKKAILIDTKNRSFREVTITDGDELKQIYDHVDCELFQCVDIDDVNTIYVDEERLYKQDKEFFTIKGYPEPIPGNGLVLGSDHETGESMSTTLTLQEIKDSVKFYSLFDIQLKMRFGQFV